MSPRRRSPARGNKSSGGAGNSSRVYHSPPLDDSPDMRNSKMIEELTIVRNVADNQIGLLADFNGTQAVGSIQRGRGVERQGGDDFRRLHLHLRAGQTADQGQIFAGTSARIAIAGQGHG